MQTNGVRTPWGVRPCVMMDAMDIQSPTYSDDELTASLVEHLASLDRDDSYRVERVLKCSDVETTELVYFEGSGGGSRSLCPQAH